MDAFSSWEIDLCVDNSISVAVLWWIQGLASTNDNANDNLTNDYGLKQAAKFLDNSLTEVVSDLIMNEQYDFFDENKGKVPLFLRLERVLLGTESPEEYNVPDKSDTAQILSRLSENRSAFGILRGLRPQKAELKKVLFSLLQNAVDLIIDLSGNNDVDRQAVHFQFYSSSLSQTYSKYYEKEDVWFDGLIPTFLQRLDRALPSAPDVVGLTSSTIRKTYRTLLVNCIGTILNTSTHSKHAISMLREQGNNLMSNSGYAQAIQRYTMAIDMCLTPDNENIPALLTNRAIAYIGLNCYPEARSDLNKAVSLDRTYTPAWAQLGYCHLYMGTTLIALRCYLTALQSAVGDVVPYFFPPGAGRSHDEYRDNKIATVMPQFIQRVIQAMILTEKRAYQQRENSDEIKSIVAKARGILARLRSTASPEDLSYFTYLYDYEDSSFRSAARQANRSRPNVLTPDVSQNIFANTNVETSSIAIPAAMNPLDTPSADIPRPLTTAIGAIRPTGEAAAAGESNTERDRRLSPPHGATRLNTGTPTTASTIFSIGGTTPRNPHETSAAADGERSSTGPADTPGDGNDVRSILNNFGQIFEGTLGAQTEVFPNDPPQGREGPTETPAETERPAETEGQGDQQTLQPQHGDHLRNIMRNYLPEGLGGMISQALGSVGGVNGGIVINGRQYDLSGNPIERQSSNSTGNQTGSQRSGQDNRDGDDIDMPDVPDLD